MHREFGERPAKAIRVSLVELIGNPEKYHRKRVCVVGLFIVSRDGPGYLFFDSPFLFDDANRIQLSVPEELREQHEGISGRGGTRCVLFQAVIRKDGEVASRMISVEF